MSETPTDLLATSPFEDVDDIAPRKPNRVGKYLLVAVVVVLGFVGGAQVQRHFGATGSAATTTPVTRTPPGGTRSGGAFPGGGMTVGTVEKVVGKTIYIRTSSGKTVTVKVGSATELAIVSGGGGLMAGPPVRLVIADGEPRGDEPSVAELMAEPLRFAGFDVLVAASGRDALRIAERDRVDLVLLDLDLPDLDGFTVVHRLQTLAHPVPALCITARDAVDDKVRALGTGADDYVTKPFSVEEVFARIRAVLRRTRGPRRARISVADLVLDDDTHDVWRAGERVSLSATEFRLLRYLMVNSGRVQSKQQIFDHVWPPDSACGFGVVESYVSYLRRKVDRNEPRLIHTLRGVGYMLRSPGR